MSADLKHGASIAAILVLYASINWLADVLAKVAA